MAPVGGGMWDENHTEPAFEIGTGITNATGDFDFNATGFFAALPGWNEIYAASYESGFIGIDGSFRLLPNGLNQRNLEVQEIEDGKFVTIDPAPRGF